MNELPPILMPGEKITNTWIRQLLRAIKRQKPLAGPGLSARITPDGTVLSAVAPHARAAERLAPFACRYHVTDDDTDGKWEVYLPYGSLSVGDVCEPVNTKMSDIDGHGDDAEDWHLLYIDESEGSPTRTRTETVLDGNGEEQNITVNVRIWNIEVHGKTSAKVDGVDQLDDDARRLMYVAARRIRAYGETPAATDEELAKYRWGDEFSAVVGTVTVETKPDLVNGGTIATRIYKPLVKSAISVAGRQKSNFDLEWYLEVDEVGDLACNAVYCRRLNQAVAGFTISGPDYVEVTDAEDSIWATIEHNQAAGENIISIEIDPDGQGLDKMHTWLKLYDASYNVVRSDYRASALVNVQVFR